MWKDIIENEIKNEIPDSGYYISLYVIFKELSKIFLLTYLYIWFFFIKNNLPLLNVKKLWLTFEDWINSETYL